MNTEYDAWIGKTEVFKEQLSELNIKRLQHTLNLDAKPLSLGEEVFPLALLILGEPSLPPNQLGEDGHPVRGEFMPPIPLKRRMFAGGEYEFFQPLRVGDLVKISWKITDVNLKQGESGELIFVNILREFHVSETLCATENRTIVYTDSEPKKSELKDREIPGEWIEEMNTDPIQLFRYSALTFNGHRIHYDRSYATEVEGYPGLVIHGPLLATWLSLFAAGKSGRQLKKFRFRGKRPVFDSHHFMLTGKKSGNDSASLRVLDHQYQLAVSAEAEFF
ncbi:MAG: MaoC family dehydratase N-terminal domain-containing protein [SAR324 cluster bacterium]|nr:MaoC family dehydratase N-terminal domain-containing protein [SAR324 cluster bacterium]